LSDATVLFFNHTCKRLIINGNAWRAWVYYSSCEDDGLDYCERIIEIDKKQI